MQSSKIISHGFIIIYIILYFIYCKGHKGSAEIPKLSLASQTNCDYGYKRVGQSNDKVLTIINTLGFKANLIEQAAINTPFAFKGGVFPGIGGSCETTLADSQSCTVVVTYSPSVEGSTNTTFRLLYDILSAENNKINSQTVSCDISGNAVIDGILDTSFGDAGKVISNFPSGFNSVSGLLLQPDGKIVVAGLKLTGSYTSAVVARYKSSGLSLDESFNETGIVTMDLGKASYFWSLALQSDGKIIAVGTVLSRFNTDGSIDTSFNSTGTVTDPLGSGNRTYGLALQSDGKIVVAGTDYSKIIISRYSSNGNLDTSFNNSGTFTSSISARLTWQSIAIQNDGKILAAGQTNESYSKYLILRLNTNGTLDTGFGTNSGYTTTTVGTIGGAPYGTALQPDGKIIVAGSSAQQGMCIIRYQNDGISDGILDSTFGDNGIKIISFPSLASSAAYSVITQPDGKILLAGEGLAGNSKWSAILARLKSNGDLDTTFGSNQDGKIISNFGSAENAYYALALRPDGKIVAGGQHAEDVINTSNYNFLLTQFNNWPDVK